LQVKIVGLKWSQTFQPRREDFQPFPPYKKDTPLPAAGSFIPSENLGFGVRMRWRTFASSARRPRLMKKRVSQYTTVVVEGENDKIRDGIGPSSLIKILFHFFGDVV